MRTILDMAQQVETQLKTLLETERESTGGTGLRPVSSQSSLAADRLKNGSAKQGGNVEAVSRGNGQPSSNEQATAERHWLEASGTKDGQEPEANRRSRGPAKMTPARKVEIIHYVQAGLSIRQAASFVGCHHTTVTKAAQRDEEFAEKLERAEAMGDALPLVRVIRASRQSWRAAAWLVKNHQPCAAFRRESAAERDAEAAESIVRLDRLVRQQAPDVDVRAVLRGGSVSVELRPRGERKVSNGER
jgi:hypothetical protein